MNRPPAPSAAASAADASVADPARPGAAAARAPIRGRSPYLAALLGWIVPGLGQVFVGRMAKGLLFFVAIAGTYALGWWLSGFSAVDPHRHPLDFAAHVFAGGPTLLAWDLSRGHVLDHLPTWLEVGRLYVLVAGLLNLVAMADAVGEAIGRTRQAVAWREELRLREVRRRQAEHDAAPSDDAAPPPESASEAGVVGGSEAGWTPPPEVRP